MLQPPIAKQKPHNFTINNITISDEYSWMRDSNWPAKVDDHNIISYLEQENDYSKAFFDQHQDLKNTLFEELKGRIKLSDQSAYVQKDDYLYYNRTEADKDYSIYCRKYQSPDAIEEIILDVNHLAKGKQFTSLGALSISPDHSMLAYSVDFNGDEKYTIRVLNLKTNEYLSDAIANTAGQIVWNLNNEGFFYTPVDEDLRHTRVMRHILGHQNDQLILQENDKLYNVSISSSGSRQYLLINISGHDNNEYHTLDLTTNQPAPLLAIARQESINYSLEHNGEYFYILTNDMGSNFRLVKLEIKTGIMEDYIDMNPSKYLANFDITANYLILNYRHQGLSEIIIKDLNSDQEHPISFPDASYTASGFSANFTLNDIRINYSSLGRPNTLYAYKHSNKEPLEILKTQEIPSGFNPNEYMVKRLWADNNRTMVPISLIYKKSLFKADGSNPLYLYGYGSYGISIAPSFRSNIFSLIDRGFVFAIAHIRGGDDLGYNWYEDAKFLNKKRTFDDFIACSEHLIKEQYTSQKNIVICGGSAGGLLVGAVMNARPELYKAVIAHVPFVDVLNTMLDETLPLTPGEFKEWGNPKDPQYFEYIQSYSPYDNIKATSYPALFVTAGLSDPRVGYWEPAKWVARLRKFKADDNILLFKTNMSFGHQGASGRFEYLKETAEDYVFILNQFGIN